MRGCETFGKTSGGQRKVSSFLSFVSFHPCEWAEIIQLLKIFFVVETNFRKLHVSAVSHWGERGKGKKKRSFWFLTHIYAANCQNYPPPNSYFISTLTVCFDRNFNLFCLKSIFEPFQLCFIFNSQFICNCKIKILLCR